MVTYPVITLLERIERQSPSAKDNREESRGNKDKIHPTLTSTVGGGKGAIWML